MEGEIEPQEPEALWQSLRLGEYDEDDLHLGKDEVAMLSDMFQVCMAGPSHDAHRLCLIPLSFPACILMTRAITPCTPFPSKVHVQAILL